jgi:hypothetical protein
MYGKKGQGLSLTTIILIVLGLAVLVFLIFGFSTGWGNLWGTITEIGGGDANVDDISRGCALACQQGGSYGFCDQKRELVISKGKVTTGSCFDFAKKNPSLGIENCNNLNCDGVGDGSSSGSVSSSGGVIVVDAGIVGVEISEEAVTLSMDNMILDEEDEGLVEEEVFA